MTKTQPRILIVGNHTCANRGDAAILRGTLKLLRVEFPDAQIEFVTRFTQAGKVVLGEEGKEDELFSERQRVLRQGVKLKSKYSKIWPWLLHYVLSWGLPRSFLPKHYRAVSEWISEFDLVIQVGGSFLIDLYGIHQFEHIMLSRLAGVKTILLGHSIGPFERKGFRRLAKAHLPKVDRIVLREGESLNLYREITSEDANVTLSGDAAWLLKDFSKVEKDNPQQRIVAFTARDLGPFAARLGVTQEQYEASLAKLLDRIAERGFRVLGVATCTPLDGYDKDDRVVVANVVRRMRYKNVAEVYSKNDFSDEDFMALIQPCSMMIGTRLHSAIMSMSRGVPAVAVLYEHKSLGVLKRLGLANLSVDITNLTSEEVWNCIDQILDGDFTESVRQQVEKEYVSTWTDYTREIKALL